VTRVALLRLDILMEGQAAQILTSDPVGRAPDDEQLPAFVAERGLVPR
jgi:hypothetical protein